MERPMLHLARSGYFADRRLPVELIRRNPQVPFPLHTHEFSELVVVLSGSGTHFTGRDEHIVGTGDAFVVEGRRAHGYRSVDELVLVNVLFDPSRLAIPESDLRAIPGYHATLDGPGQSGSARRPMLRLGAEQLAQVERLIDALERECVEKRPGYRSSAAGYFMQIVGFLAACSQSRPPSPPRSAVALSDAMHFLERNLHRRVRMRELVALSKMSESSLLRAFKKAIGISPLRYHLRLQIERACELLARPEFSITEVSYRSGFSDSNYFSRQFRKEKLRTPTEYRREAFSRSDPPAGPGTS